jgi:plastocyanin
VFSPTPEASPTCSPTGTELEIVAEADPANSGPSRYRFERDCLAAPADTPFSIRFDNRDADLHNIEILDHPGGVYLWVGKNVEGPKVFTYKVGALPAGTYYFRCEFHPLVMHGTFIVSG